MGSFWLVILSLISLWTHPSYGDNYRALSTKQAKKKPGLLHQYAKEFYYHHNKAPQMSSTENATCKTDARTGMAFAHIQLIFANRNKSLTHKYVKDHRYFLLPMYQALISELKHVNETATPLGACSFIVKRKDSNSNATTYDGLACVHLKGMKGKERQCKWCGDSPFKTDTQREATARLCKMNKKGKILDLDSSKVIPHIKSGSRSINADGRRGGAVVVVTLLMTLIIK